ncbi:4-phosphopantoate--beta-alanine ligase [Haloarcula montana]|uniref:4-phosphopantoate--beta-alanine ligase n=1 Tax=Haloarcula montana TaxID=3111776 RepID=UPI002D76EE88|nr:4-phosphopantoate--beta-alanine ligase [Haloarcula sp. GH36]
MTEEVSVPESHPRYESLLTRHRIEAGVERGITSKQGLIAEGRGEAFDYLLGEETTDSADRAARAAAAYLLSAEHAVVSVNGNAAALVPEELVELADVTGAELEVNLFNRSRERIEAIADYLREHGAEGVKGLDADARIPGLDHERAKVDSDGIYDADVVLVPLEDGDRAEALGEMGKTELVVDLNPLSRSPQVATVPIVDNIIRAIPTITDHARELAGDPAAQQAAIETFDADAALADAKRRIREVEA